MGSKINTHMKVKLPHWLPPAPHQSLVFLAFDWTQKRLLMGSPLWASRGPHSRHIFKRRVQLLASDRKSKFLNLALVLGVSVQDKEKPESEKVDTTRACTAVNRLSH